MRRLPRRRACPCPDVRTGRHCQSVRSAVRMCGSLYQA
ncbi:hypothetical protein KKY_941 [Pelagibacterium halotolerans B2]|uniref:Uncharacterized protein n=1 Tax=Pelagibacterium halotolerans (strain DSM 22347 / JCM 15775 / CGMCC 1.7692 / B2) TaxID=1082931 RepID=G4RFA9_PELHB|nr:hypothetical protein KKY_941 [Pelagibacterium halotolerans B2]